MLIYNYATKMFASLKLNPELLPEILERIEKKNLYSQMG